MIMDDKRIALSNKDEAIRLHRLMWNELFDIDKKRNNKLVGSDRVRFIRAWLTLHSYDFVENECFLCEYAKTQANNDEYDLFCAEGTCKHCPLNWTALTPNLNNTVHDFGTCFCRACINNKEGELWLIAPIEGIANLPEKKEEQI